MSHRSPALAAFLSAAVLALGGCADVAERHWQTTEEGGLFAASFDPAGEHLLTASVFHGASLWRVSDATRLHDWQHGEDAGALVATAFSPDGQHAATAERHRIVLWDTGSGRALGFWSTTGGIQALALSAGGRRLLVGLHDNHALLIDTASAQPLARIRHGSAVTAVAISADGRFGVTGASDGIVQSWTLDSGEAGLSWKFDGAVTVLTLAGDGSLLFGARAHGKGQIWRLPDGQPVATIGQPRTTIVSARFAADNGTLLTGLPGGRIMLWNSASGELLHHWQAAQPTGTRASGLSTLAVAYGARPGSVLGAYSDGSVRTWAR